MKNKNYIFINIIMVLVVIISAIYSLYLFSPPEAVSKDAPLFSFSAERAMRHVRQMGQKPHFIGTEEHGRVREYIVSEAKKLGLTTEIQEATAVHYYHHRLITARVHNVIAILKGTDSSKGVLIVGHYDSVLHAPGERMMVRWNQHFFTSPRIEPLADLLPGTIKPYLKNDAPLVNLPVPVVKILADGIENNKRKLRFNLSSSRQANAMILFFYNDAGITGIRFDGKPIEYKRFYSVEKSDCHSMFYWAVPPGGIDFLIECEAGKNVQLVVVEEKPGLPDIPGYEYKPMPAHIIPDTGYSHMSLLKKAFLL